MTVTLKMLQHKVEYINEVFGHPKEPYTKNDNGVRANVGNYHLSQAYGGVALVQIVNESGGVTMPMGYGHVPKRELYNQLLGFTAGIQAMKSET